MKMFLSSSIIVFSVMNINSYWKTLENCNEVWNNINKRLLIRYIAAKLQKSMQSFAREGFYY